MALSLSHSPFILRLPLRTQHPARDDQPNGMSCEPMGDTHEYIREVGGRQYNAQNTMYFLPAGESS
jgi:hypothetical protein